MKEEIDIERLLVWTYRNQCADRCRPNIYGRVGAAQSNAARIESYFQLGTKIDAPSFASRMAALRTHADAARVDEFVIEADDVFIEWRGDEAFLWDCVLAVEQDRFIEVIGGSWTLSPLPDARGAVKPARLDRVEIVPLLIKYAKLDERPEC